MRVYVYLDPVSVSMKEKRYNELFVWFMDFERVCPEGVNILLPYYIDGRVEYLPTLFAIIEGSYDGYREEALSMKKRNPAHRYSVYSKAYIGLCHDIEMHSDQPAVLLEVTRGGQLSLGNIVIDSIDEARKYTTVKVPYSSKGISVAPDALLIAINKVAKIEPKLVNPHILDDFDDDDYLWDDEIGGTILCGVPAHPVSEPEIISPSEASNSRAILKVLRDGDLNHTPDGWFWTKDVAKETGLNPGYIEEIAEKIDEMELNEKEGMVKALYGHRFKVDYGSSSEPPYWLYLDVGNDDLKRLFETGQLSSSMHYMLHLYSSEPRIPTSPTADHVTLQIDSDSMYEDGFKFYQAGDDVYLTLEIMAKYVSRDDYKSNSEFIITTYVDQKTFNRVISGKQAVLYMPMDDCFNLVTSSDILRIRCGSSYVDTKVAHKVRFSEPSAMLRYFPASSLGFEEGEQVDLDDLVEGWSGDELSETGLLAILFEIKRFRKGESDRGE